MIEEGRRLEEARHPATPWKKWGLYLSERRGVRCARTTATRATPETTSAMTRRARAPTDGAKTGSPVSRTIGRFSASRSPSGTVPGLHATPGGPGRRLAASRAAARMGRQPHVGSFRGVLVGGCRPTTARHCQLQPDARAVLRPTERRGFRGPYDPFARPHESSHDLRARRRRRRRTRTLCRSTRLGLSRLRRDRGPVTAGRRGPRPTSRLQARRRHASRPASRTRGWARRQSR